MSQPGTTTLVIEGTLGADACAALRHAAAAALDESGSRVVLHLGGLRGTDDRGLALLFELSEQGVQLASPTLYLQQLIQERSR